MACSLILSFSFRLDEDGLPWYMYQAGNSNESDLEGVWRRARINLIFLSHFSGMR